jgi:hypothetical protein
MRIEYEGQALDSQEQIVIFYKHKCQACAAMRKTIERICTARDVYMIDVQQYEKLFDSWGLEVYPAFVLLHRGELEEAYEGTATLAELAEVLHVPRELLR